MHLWTKNYIFHVAQEKNCLSLIIQFLSQAISANTVFKLCLDRSQSQRDIWPGLDDASQSLPVTQMSHHSWPGQPTCVIKPVYMASAY